MSAACGKPRVLINLCCRFFLRMKYLNDNWNKLYSILLPIILVVVQFSVSRGYPVGALLTPKY